MPQATPAEGNDSAALFSFPAVARKKVTAAFDGGRLTSDGGVLILAQAERELGLCVSDGVDAPTCPSSNKVGHQSGLSI